VWEGGCACEWVSATACDIWQNERERERERERNRWEKVRATVQDPEGSKTKWPHNFVGGTFFRFHLIMTTELRCWLENNDSKQPHLSTICSFYQ